MDEELPLSISPVRRVQYGEGERRCLACVLWGTHGHGESHPKYVPIGMPTRWRVRTTIDRGIPKGTRLWLDEYRQGNLTDSPEPFSYADGLFVVLDGSDAGAVIWITMRGSENATWRELVPAFLAPMS